MFQFVAFLYYVELSDLVMGWRWGVWVGGGEGRGHFFKANFFVLFFVLLKEVIDTMVVFIHFIEVCYIQCEC